MKIALLALFLCGQPLLADPLDKSSQEALTQTMELLRSPEKRKEVSDKDPKAREAEDNVLTLTGNAKNTEKLYELAAQIMQSLVQQTGGDTDKMMKLMEQARKDPAAFAKNFTPQQQKLLKELGRDIEKNKTPNSVP